MAVNPQLVLPLLEDIEELPPDATGALVFGPRERPTGTVLVQRGRICWAAASGMRRRLTDLLRSQSGVAIERERVEEIYKRCRTDSIPLGETLVAEGVVSVAGLARALRQHTVEAMMSLGTAGLASWVAHSGRPYDERFTFSATEIWVGAGALVHPRLAANAKRELDDVLEVDGSGAAFARGAGWSGAIPVAIERASRLKLAELSALGRWAIDTLDVCHAFAPEHHLVTATESSGKTILAWSSGSTAFVALCNEPSVVAAAVVKRERRRRAERAQGSE